MAAKKRKCATKIYVYEGEGIRKIYQRVRDAFSQTGWVRLAVDRKRKLVTMIYVYEGEDIKTVNQRVRDAFEWLDNPPDLSEYCIPVEDILAELEALDREAEREKKRKRKHAG